MWNKNTKKTRFVWQFGRHTWNARKLEIDAHVIANVKKPKITLSGRFSLDSRRKKLEGEQLN